MRLIDDSDIAQLKRPIQRLGRRLALLRAVKALETWGTIPLAWCTAASAISAFWPDFAAKNRGTAFLLGSSILALSAYRVIRALAPGPGPRTLGLRIDRAYGPADRLTNALCFAVQSCGPRSSLTAIAVSEGVNFAKSVDISRVVPLRSRLFWRAGALTVLCLTVLFLSAGGPRKRHFSQATAVLPARTDRARALSEDLQAIKSRLSNWAHTVTDPDTAAKAEQLLALIRHLETGQARRDSTLGELARLTRELRPREGTDLPSGGNPTLGTLGAVLSKDPVTRSLGRALEGQSLTDAKQALEALQNRLRDPRRKLDPAVLARLRLAIEQEQQEHAQKAAADLARSRGLGQRRKELSAAEQRGRLTPSERDEKNQLEHKLEHLDRNRTRREAASAALSALDRELSAVTGKVARLLGDQTPLFSALRQELSAAESTQYTEDQKRQLLAELRALEESLQNFPQADALRNAAIDRFRNRATGHAGAGDRSRHEPRVPRGTGAPVDAGGPSAGNGATVASNPEGRTLWLRHEADRPSAESEPATPTEAGAGSGRPREGSFHDPNLRGEPSALATESSQDTTALTSAGAEATVSVEAVSVAAQRGFSGQRYAPVYHAYAPVQEAWLKQTDLPLLRRNQVRRYFEFIRPRP